MAGAIDLALQGVGSALRLCLNSIVPPRKDSPIAFPLPPITTAANTVTASSSLLAAVAAGKVTPNEAWCAILPCHTQAGAERLPPAA